MNKTTFQVARNAVTMTNATHNGKSQIRITNPEWFSRNKSDSLGSYDKDLFKDWLLDIGCTQIDDNTFVADAANVHVSVDFDDPFNDDSIVSQNFACVFFDINGTTYDIAGLEVLYLSDW